MIITEDMPVCTLEKMYYATVRLVMHYGNEVWGFNRTVQLNMVYTYFPKRISGQSKSVANCGILFDFGAFSDTIHYKIRTLKYWLRVIQGEKTKLRTICYNCQSRNVDSSCRTNEIRKGLEKNRYGLGLGKREGKP